VNCAAPPFFIIAGSTAVGKSELAISVAEHCHGEIVSADAFQIYQGLDILTAKPPSSLRAQVPHHFISEIPLTQSFDVAQYLGLARERIAAIQSRGRLPIIVGGTGLYLRALTHGLAELPTADIALRAQLDAQPTAELGRRLATLDLASHARIDLQNRRRVIRALEVCLLTGRPFSSFREEWKAPAAVACGVILQRSRDELHRRIQQRTEAMFAAGVVEEVRHTGPIKSTASQTLGWRQIRALIDGTMTRDDCVMAIQQATRRYAKRQLTWFRREPYLKFIDLPDDIASPELIADLAERAQVR
jgi:tRNA dimethylallyltransferase